MVPNFFSFTSLDVGVIGWKVRNICTTIQGTLWDRNEAIGSALSQEGKFLWKLAANALSNNHFQYKYHQFFVGLLLFSNFPLPLEIWKAYLLFNLNNFQMVIDDDHPISHKSYIFPYINPKPVEVLNMNEFKK